MNTPVRILVVDDEPSLRALLRRVLEEEGYEVVGLEDGKAGLDAVKTADTAYDLVITNGYAPHITGPELIGQLRHLFPGLPILHLDELSHSPEPVGDAAPTLYQPFSLDALLNEVHRLIRKRGVG